MMGGSVAGGVVVGVGGGRGFGRDVGVGCVKAVRKFVARETLKKIIGNVDFSPKHMLLMLSSNTHMLNAQPLVELLDNRIAERLQRQQLRQIRHQCRLLQLIVGTGTSNSIGSNTSKTNTRTQQPQHLHDLASVDETLRVAAVQFGEKDVALAQHPHGNGCRTALHVVGEQLTDHGQRVEQTLMANKQKNAHSYASHHNTVGFRELTPFNEPTMTANNFSQCTCGQCSIRHSDRKLSNSSCKTRNEEHKAYARYANR